ncbi:ATP-dependent zinc protease family protein [Salidesulfovibrio onnuriiensis]|uniref:ATP-dependent zinc protease family protein n=1 Tax=Salidesulfovibrio onnuriiensis TaxID=2583823 RepID=UPI00164FA9A3|nr:ATP-dependent zinc protease [Salidesulfovibrio onnuriiensis]
MRVFLCVALCLAMVVCAACTPKNQPSFDPVYGPQTAPPLLEWYGDGNCTGACEGDPFDVCAEERKKLEKKLRKEFKKKFAARKAAEPKVKFENLLIIGQKEYVYFDQLKMKLPARIDTGATTSSIDATDLQQYERDGEDWLRFTITDPASGKAVVLERPLKRTVRIKQHEGDGQRRYVVELQVQLGSQKCTTEFSLTDRSDFKMPVLIGRSLLHGRAVVDVTREYITSPLNDSNEKQ